MTSIEAREQHHLYQTSTGTCDPVNLMCHYQARQISQRAFHKYPRRSLWLHRNGQHRLVRDTGFRHKKMSRGVANQVTFLRQPKRAQGWEWLASKHH